MSKPVMLVCLLVILIVTSQFEWRQQPLVDLDAPNTTISQKQQQLSDREEAVKEKIIITQERHIQKLNELVRSLQLQLLQCKGENGTQNATKSFHSDKQFIEVERKQIFQG
ncbi:Peptidyl-prolyl cis-trans isomerase G [Hirschfeldia incana]|nr:Peptidyl-prolyl cis-trans isomerase G [Hirschfeldia incana]KAJ0248246.1 Peptidyl-prolyl cis-trans isomerase G [Hirschfeldia incana]